MISKVYTFTRGGPSTPLSCLRYAVKVRDLEGSRYRVYARAMAAQAVAAAEMN